MKIRLEQPMWSKLFNSTPSSALISRNGRKVVPLGKYINESETTIA